MEKSAFFYTLVQPVKKPATTACAKHTFCGHIGLSQGSSYEKGGTSYTLALHIGTPEQRTFNGILSMGYYGNCHC